MSSIITPLQFIIGVPVRPHAVIGHSVTPGDQTQGQDDAGPPRQEEHTHTEQDRQEGRKQGAEQKHTDITHT